jgi:hypothetical protein
MDIVGQEYGLFLLFAPTFLSFSLLQLLPSPSDFSSLCPGFEGTVRLRILNKIDVCVDISAH